MKKHLIVLSIFFSPAFLFADLASGPPVSDPAGPFTVVKCGGAADGVEPGTELCYRSKYGNATQVIVFSRNAEAVVELAKQLDQLATQVSGLHAFVNILGADPVNAEEAAAKLAKRHNSRRSWRPFPSRMKTDPPDMEFHPKRRSPYWW